MAILGISDILSLVQTIGIIVTLVLTLYFSHRQIKTMAVDLETRVLNDVDEKVHHLIEIFIGSPQLIKTMWNVPSQTSPELAVAYYALFTCSHIYHMKERKILSDNEWAGWLQWIKNGFRYGDLGKYWKEQAEMESWFDPSFRDFINNEILPSISTPTVKAESEKLSS